MALERQSATMRLHRADERVRIAAALRHPFRPPRDEGSAKRKTKKARAAKASDGRLSQLDAAVKVLRESGQPMSTKDMVETMGAKGYWSSPGGRTPEATLYSAILREVKNKGSEARFLKTERGRFTLKA